MAPCVAQHGGDMAEAGGQTKARDLVRIAGRVVHRSLADSDPGEWQRLLSKAVNDEPQGVCLCRGGAQPLPMSVAKAGKVFAFKRMPYSGPSHHPGCDSHGLDLRAFRQSNRLPAIRATAGDGLDVKLDVPLSSRAANGSAEPRQRSAAAPHTGLGTSRDEISLLGFMHLVWELAGLNRWAPATSAAPGKRKLGQVYRAVEEVLSEISVVGRQANALVYVPTSDLRPEAQLAKRDALNERYMSLQANADSGERPIMIVLAEALRLFQSKHGYGLSMKGMPDPVWLKPEGCERLKRSWPGAARSLEMGDGKPAQQSHRVFVMAGVQLSQAGSLNWTYGVLMPTSDDFIPVDSRYERDVADLLVLQRRSFTKPLRYTAAEDTHPDFLLTDHRPEVVMEVYGMATPEYLARKAEKAEIYRRNQTMTWAWEAHKGDPMPAFPPATA